MFLFFLVLSLLLPYQFPLHFPIYLDRISKIIPYCFPIYFHIYEPISYFPMISLLFFPMISYDFPFRLYFHLNII